MIPAMANLRAKTLDFGGFDSSRTSTLGGWNSHVHGECPGSFGSANLSRDNLGGEIGRSSKDVVRRQRVVASTLSYQFMCITC